MLKFRPIAYNEGDFRTFKYTGASDITEGQICWATASKLDRIHIRAYSGTADKGFARATQGSDNAGATIMYYGAIGKMLFPVYRENPDPENVTATIKTNDFVIGFFGQEYEIHKSVTESGYATTFTMNGIVCCGSNGKFAKYNGKNYTAYTMGYCIGTFNGKWIRIRSTK